MYTMLPAGMWRRRLATIPIILNADTPRRWKALPAVIAARMEPAPIKLLFKERLVITSAILMYVVTTRQFPAIPVMQIVLLLQPVRIALTAIILRVNPEVRVHIVTIAPAATLLPLPERPVIIPMTMTVAMLRQAPLHLVHTPVLTALAVTPKGLNAHMSSRRTPANGARGFPTATTPIPAPA